MATSIRLWLLAWTVMFALIQPYRVTADEPPLIDKTKHVRGKVQATHPVGVHSIGLFPISADRLKSIIQGDFVQRQHPPGNLCVIHSLYPLLVHLFVSL